MPQEAKHWNTEKDDKVVNTEEEVLERWKEYFDEILYVACEESDLPEGCQLGDCKKPIEMDTDHFTMKELR